MTSTVIVVRKETRVNDLIGTLLQNKISCAPVVDENGALIGIVTKTDVIGHLLDMDLDITFHGAIKNIVDKDIKGYKLDVSLEGELTVEKIMTNKPITAKENDSIQKLAEKMINKKIHRLIITKGKKITGIISTLDIISHVAGKK